MKQWWIRPEEDYRTDHIITPEEKNEEPWHANEPGWVHVVEYAGYERLRKALEMIESASWKGCSRCDNSSEYAYEIARDALADTP